MSAIKKRAKGARGSQQCFGSKGTRSRPVEEGIAWTRQVDNELKAGISRLLKAGELAEDGI